jgi:hypothetical protein
MPPENHPAAFSLSNRFPMLCSGCLAWKAAKPPEKLTILLFPTMES